MGVGACHERYDDVYIRVCASVERVGERYVVVE